jgi:hypothetical protein
MQKIFVMLSFVAGLSLLYCYSAAAMPTAALQQAARAVSSAQQVQCWMVCPDRGYKERRTKNYLVKCYRDLVTGAYGCHRYRNK